MTKHTHMVVESFSRYERVKGSMVGEWREYEPGNKITPTEQDLRDYPTCFKPIGDVYFSVSRLWNKELSLQINASWYETTCPDAYGNSVKSNDDRYTRSYRSVVDVALQNSTLTLGHHLIQLAQIRQAQPRAGWAWTLFKHNLNEVSPTPIEFCLKNVKTGECFEFVGNVVQVTATEIEISVVELKGVSQQRKKEDDNSFIKSFMAADLGMEVLADDIGPYLGDFETAVKLAAILPPHELWRHWLLSQGILADADMLRRMLNDILTYDRSVSQENESFDLFLEQGNIKHKGYEEKPSWETKGKSEDLVNSITRFVDAIKKGDLT